MRCQAFDRTSDEAVVGYRQGDGPPRANLDAAPAPPAFIGNLGRPVDTKGAGETDIRAGETPVTLV